MHGSMVGGLQASEAHELGALGAPAQVHAGAPALQGWLGRHHGATVSLEIDGDKLTLADASEADQRRLVETFLARHGAG